MRIKPMKKNEPVINPELFSELRDLLVETTGNSEREVFLEADLEEDLGLNLDEDLTRLIKRVNQRFEIHLVALEVLEELEEVGASVAELAKLINDEHELG